MTPYLADPDVTLYQGDALEILRELPDESVHCVATSPPFFGLRDYGTGRWEGGEAACDHKMPLPKGGSSTLTNWAGTSDAQERYAEKLTSTRSYPGVCGKCGARRVDQQIGLEASPDAWAARLVEVFRETRRVLRRDGSLWVECGDSYASQQSGFRPGSGRADGIVDDARNIRNRNGVNAPGLKPKDLIGQPFLLAFALRADGWYWRGCNIWAKPNAMPESAKDRCTVAHSYVLHFSKSARYFFDGDAIAEPAVEGTDLGLLRGRSQAGPGADGSRVSWHAPSITKRQEAGIDSRNGNPSGMKNPRSVWTIPTQGFPEAHFATWPEALARRIILAAVPEQVCGVCGKARERIVEREPNPTKGTTGPNMVPIGARGEVDPRYRKHSGTIASPPGEFLGFTDCGHDAYTPGVVLDPFAGSGTTLYVARKHNRRAIGIDLNEAYLEMAARRLAQQSLFAEPAA